MTMRRLSRRAELALIIAILGVLAPAFSTGARQAQAAGTLLTTQPVKPLPLGGRAVVDAQLATVIGTPVADAPLVLLMDGVREGQEQTDATGLASFRIQRDLPGLLPSRASTELIVHPAQLEIRTAPPLPGVRFSLEGRIVASDWDGMARIQAEKAGTYRLEVLSSDDATSGDSDTRVEFSRWADEVLVP